MQFKEKNFPSSKSSQVWAWSITPIVYANRKWFKLQFHTRISLRNLQLSKFTPSYFRVNFAVSYATRTTTSRNSQKMNFFPLSPLTCKLLLQLTFPVFFAASKYMQHLPFSMIFEVFTTMIMKMNVFWDVLLCNFVILYRRCKGNC